MSLEEKINQDIKEAMIARDQAKLLALRGIKSAILLAKTEKAGQKALTTVEENKLLNKMVKQRRDSLSIYESQGREDLAEQERKELATIEIYLPIQMDDDQIREAVSLIITQLGATSVADLGKVMGACSKELAGKADNRKVAEIIRAILS
jgi:uncharacterized protein